MEQFNLEFLDRVYRDGLEKYIQRLKSLGFVDGVFLDAGCGFGQWSLAASRLNTRVVGIDVSRERIEVAQEVALEKSIQNIVFDVQDLESIPYSKNFFDYIFSYSVLYMTNWRDSLKEMLRVVRGGGVFTFVAMMWVGIII